MPPNSESRFRGRNLRRGLTAEGVAVLVSMSGSRGQQPVAALQREYGLRTALSDDWAAMPLALVPQDGETVLLLRDTGGTPLSERATGPLAPGPFLALASELAAVTLRMHAAGLVHCALSPDCILVDDDTGRATLTGFGCALRQGEEATHRGIVESMAWNPAAIDYLAPELGSRMNRQIDARADLYSLGCIFHEMLVGVPPFGQGDAGARLHAHATIPPQPAHRLRSDVPEQLSRLVLRLLEKAPERRYADAAALLNDLRASDELYRRHGHIPAFPLDAGAAIAGGSHDGPVFVGRDLELEQLLLVHADVQSGAGMGICWVAGLPGIGKSTLLREAVARMATSPALPRVATGKASSDRGSRPFDVLAQALEPLLQMVLGSPDAAFDAWRERLSHATRDAAPTLVRLLPSLGAILGTTPTLAPSPVAPVDASRGFEREIVQRAMARVITCFATPERPLVLLLDDLQWVDVETVHVLERLLSDHVQVPLLLLGSLRSTGAPDEHPVCATSLYRASRAVHIRLNPLDAGSVHQLLAQTFDRDPGELGPLVDVVERRTGRNPFFMRRLLGRLVNDRVITYDTLLGRWTWQDGPATAHDYLAGIGDLLARDVQDLPPATRRLLQILACLGDRASTSDLAIADACAATDVPVLLTAAIAPGFVSRDGDDWVFTHDHLREAAYASIPEGDRAEWHLGIVRRQQAHAEEVPIFSRAAQAWLARSAVKAPDERRAFAHIHVEAGKRARATTAHHSALAFFRSALECLAEDATSPLAMEANLLCGEAEFLTGALEAAEDRLSALQRQAGDGLFGADLARLRAALYTTLGAFEQALAVGLGFLAKAGIMVPAHPDDTEVQIEYQRLCAWLDANGVEALRQLPIDADPVRRGIVDIFAELLPPALYFDQNLFDLMLVRMVHLAIEHGHTDASANGYACMNHIFGMRFGDYAQARDFGALALHLVNERGLQRYQARVYHTYGTFVVPWTAPARQARGFIGKAFDIATRVGDHTFALYCGRNQATGMLFAGESLEEVRETVEHALVRARDANFGLVINALLAQLAFLGRLQDGRYDAEVMAEPVEGALATLVDLAYWVHRLQADFLFGDLTGAIEAGRRAEACKMAARSFAEFGELPYYGALALLALPARDPGQQALLHRHLAALAEWDAVCPENFGARHALVRAEFARVAGNDAEALAHYDDAVSEAREHGFTQVEALAAELAADFHASRRHEAAARACARDALVAWQRWGATAKARQLQLRFPGLLDADVPTTAGHGLRELDVHAVLRITNALASDLVPERLIETTMRTALESTGASYGALALWREGEWRVRATARTSGRAIVVTQESAALSAEVAPVAVVLAVARTQQPVQVDDVREGHALAQDHGVHRARARSLLCVPMMRYAKLVGVLYLENDLAPRVFTAAKARLLDVIASQASFALENMRLYEALIEQHRQRMEAKEQLRSALTELERSSRLKAMGELVASIVHEIGQPLSAIDSSASAAGRWLNRDEPEIDEARSMITHIGLSAKRAKNIIRQLRAMARKAEPQFADIDLTDALRECASLLAGPLADLGASLALDVPQATCHVRGDRIQLQQVVINLLMNGAESMTDRPAGARELFLSWFDAGDGFADVVVEDCGSGLSAEAASRLMEPFFTTKPTGMGMGLAISKSIADAHGGTLTFAPRGEGGTRATFRIPLEADAPGLDASDSLASGALLAACR